MGIFDKRKEEEKKKEEDVDAKVEPNRVDVTAAEAETIRAEKVAKLTQVLTRGMTNSQLEIPGAHYDKALNVWLDSERVYCWPRHMEEDINYMKNLGFKVETSKGEGSHGKGDGTRVVGDVILMSITRDDYTILCEVKNQQKARRRQLSAKKDYVLRARMDNPDVAVLDPLDVLGEQLR